MTADNITALCDRLDALLAAATPGEWRQDGTMIAEGRHLNTIVDCWEDAADAALIVAAVNALPELTRAVRAVLDLADWYDGQPNWREWGIGRQIRAAVTAAQDGAGQ